VGANLVRVVEPCVENPDEPGDIGAEATCVASCPPGHAATGGGFEVGPVFFSFADVRSSVPNPSNGDPTGCAVQIQFIDVGQQVDYSAYALCLPQ
jgi:hypothetical protein